MDKWSRLFAGIDALAAEDLETLDRCKAAAEIVELSLVIDALRAEARRREAEIARRNTRGQSSS